MSAETTNDPDMVRQGLEALIASVEDQIADTLTALGQAGATGADADTLTDLAKQAQALSDHLRTLRHDLAAIDQALTARRMFIHLRAALLEAVDAIDQLQGSDVTAIDSEPGAATVADLRQALGALRFTDLRPAIMS